MPLPTFVKVDVTEAVEVVYEEDAIHPDDALGWLVDLVDDGYKVSLSSKPDEGSYAVYITGKAGTPNDGLCVGQWSSSLSKSAAKLYLLHVVIGKNGDWRNVSKNINDTFRDLLRQAKASR